MLRRIGLVSLPVGLAICVAALACGPAEVSHEGLDPMVAQRHVRLEGAPNFRDLGGYATADGQRVAWGKLYRSGDLSELTAADLEAVDALGLSLVCDLRSDEERAEAPDRLPTPSPDVAIIPIQDKSLSVSELRSRILSGDLDGLDLEQLLVDGNRAFVSRFLAEYREMFERISEPDNLPALVHCTAGKDRAGLASAIALLALGVPRDTVMEDFLLTNHYVSNEVESTLRTIRLASLLRTDPEEVRPILEVRRAYLEAAFDEMEERYGSFDGYLREGLGVTHEELADFRELLLE